MKNTKKAATTQTPKAIAKKTAPAAKTLKADAGALEIHINKTGRICFGKTAAARIGNLGFMTLAADGKEVKLIASAKSSDDAVEIRRAGKRPYVSGARFLKAFGFDGKKALDITAAPLNGTGFRFRLAA